MTYNGSMGGSSQEGAKYQPKFKDRKLEAKGGDETLRRWIALLGSIVMNAVWGKYLESFATRLWVGLQKDTLHGRPSLTTPCST